MKNSDQRYSFGAGNRVKTRRRIKKMAFHHCMLPIWVKLIRAMNYFMLIQRPTFCFSNQVDDVLEQKKAGITRDSTGTGEAAQLLAGTAIAAESDQNVDEAMRCGSDH